MGGLELFESACFRSMSLGIEGVHACEVQVCPTVSLVALEAFTKRNEGAVVSVSVLMGEWAPGAILRLTDALPLPHVEPLLLETDSVKRVLSLGLQESAVGLCVCGEGVRSSLELVNICVQFVQMFGEEPYVVLLDINPKVPLSAFSSRVWMNLKKPVLAVLQPVAIKHAASHVERFGVDCLLRSAVENQHDLSAPSVLLQDMESLESSLAQFQADLEFVINSLGQGAVPPEVERVASKIANLKAYSDQVGAVATEGVQDLLMVSYLLSQLKVQIAAGDKISQIV